jgi:dTDP-4-dehydrorhamnose reductase
MVQGAAIERLALGMSQKILVLGASGMLGNAVLRYLADTGRYDAVGSVRSEGSFRLLPEALRPCLVAAGDADDPDRLIRLLGRVRPEIVINCIGLVKQLGEAKNPLAAIPINAVLPHRLAQACVLVGARLVHLSTDCVFSGRKGMYIEDDVPDADDIYGRTKLLGEVDYPHAVTLRTSIIGHELAGHRSLIDWFLAQEGSVRGFTRAIFSGLPTVEIARVIDRHVLPDTEMHGLYHLSAAPIDKASLLRLVADVYGKRIVIEDDDSLVIDRSLNSDRFRQRTGYRPDPWPALIEYMYDFR